MQKTYLGDGLYAEINSENKLVLTAEKDGVVTDTISFSTKTFGNLLARMLVGKAAKLETDKVETLKL